MRIFSVIVAMAMLVTTASASTAGLKTAFDELEYALSVEWDQKDQAFYQAEMDKFNKKIAALKEQGLTNQELVAFVKSEVKNEQVARDLDTAVSLMTIGKMDQNDATKFVLDSVKKSYDRGASWNGIVAVNLISLLVILAIFAAVSSGGDGDTTTDNGGGYVCSNVYQCGYSYVWTSVGYEYVYHCYWTCI